MRHSVVLCVFHPPAPPRPLPLGPLKNRSAFQPTRETGSEFERSAPLHAAGGRILIAWRHSCRRVSDEPISHVVRLLALPFHRMHHSKPLGPGEAFPEVLTLTKARAGNAGLNILTTAQLIAA